MTKKFTPNTSDFESLNPTIKYAISKLANFGILVMMDRLKPDSEIDIPKLVRDSIVCGLKLGIDSSINLEDCYNCKSDCNTCRKRNSLLYKSANFYENTPMYIKAQALAQSANEQAKKELKKQFDEVKSFL